MIAGLGGGGGGGREGQDRGTDVRCIVDEPRPGAAFVSAAFKSTRSHSAASCLPGPSPSLLLGSSWRNEGRGVTVGGPSWPGSWPIRSIWYRRRGGGAGEAAATISC
ncbi:hypothetical protein WMY93_032817 [Mugilogobius chulae]|uniref:Uncharacterized protein n=1 Tax=Mugilogobius chulae TaxID=88201 RepID=A0AAW0MV95_9GOBI